MSDPPSDNRGTMRKQNTLEGRVTTSPKSTTYQLELWKDFAIVARFGRAWIIDINGELHLSGGSKQEQAEAIEFASMFLADRALRIKLPPIKLRPIDEVKLRLEEAMASKAPAPVQPLVRVPSRLDRSSKPPCSASRRSPRHTLYRHQPRTHPCP